MQTPAEMFDLTGRVALVTGGSRGLGREISLGLAGAGADVVVVSRKLDACVAVAGEIEAVGRRALALACHVGKWDQIDRMLQTVEERFGRIDVLVNNAGMSPVYESPQSISEELFDKTLAVNLKGPFRLVTRVGAAMAAGSGGSIINISSTAAERPGRDVMPYAAAKAGLGALTIAAACAFGPAVRVNTVMPGAFRTDATAAWDPRAVAEMAARWPLSRLAEPGEIVGAVLYLASSASSYCTGATITVDGGGRWPRRPTLA